MSNKHDSLLITYILFQNNEIKNDDYVYQKSHILSEVGKFLDGVI